MIKTRKTAEVAGINWNILSLKPLNTLCWRVSFHTWPGTYGFFHLCCASFTRNRMQSHTTL